MDESKVEALMGQMVGHMTGSMVCLGGSLISAVAIRDSFENG